MEDEDRLMYTARNQDKLRAEYLQGIFDTVEKGLSEGHQIGKRVLLLSESCRYKTLYYTKLSRWYSNMPCIWTSRSFYYIYM
uniref:Uncharacterized protein n=1 Tax=Arundo donax TaxID=35708 RepID=A0A0A8YJA9_ARUDO